jgi:hypothetical protein
MEAAILRILSQEANTGEDLCKMLGAEPDVFRVAARNLWLDGLIQGELADGCCSAPCGTMCVSAMKMPRVWQLSKKGRLRLKVMAAKGETI